MIDVELTPDMVDGGRDRWNMTCLEAGIPAISTDTAARLMAVMAVHGNNEYMVFNPLFLADVRYIQIRFGLHGAGTPDADFAMRLRSYVDELAAYERAHKDDPVDGAVFKSSIPQWAGDLFKERYGIKLIN